MSKVLKCPWNWNLRKYRRNYIAYIVKLKNRRKEWMLKLFKFFSPRICM